VERDPGHFAGTVFDWDAGTVHHADHSEYVAEGALVGRLQLRRSGEVTGEQSAPNLGRHGPEKAINTAYS
jgi:hypothetical protein